MDKFVQSGGQLLKGPNGVEFGNRPEEGIWFKAKPTFDELIDAVYKKLGWEPMTHNMHAQGRLNVGDGAHRHFMVPIDDDMSWSSYVKAVFNGTEWNCLEIFVQAENCSSAEGISSDRALMTSEPLDAQHQNDQPRNSEQGISFDIPSMVTAVHTEVQSSRYQSGDSGIVDTTSYALIGLYDADHRARALASGQHLTELNPRTREPLRFDKRPDVVKLKYPNVEELEDGRDRPTVGRRWVVLVRACRAAPAHCYEHFTNEFDLLTDDQLRYTPRAHLIHLVTDKLTTLAKEATSQKGCSGSECRAFVEQVSRTCVEIIGELGVSSLCDIVDLVLCSPTTTIDAAEPEVEQQRDKQEDINHSIAPDQETESGLDSEKRSQFKAGHKQADKTVHSRSSGKRKRGRPGST
ncbi:hypothetical protein ABZP36_014579 [Zizania latifolia]